MQFTNSLKRTEMPYNIQQDFIDLSDKVIEDLQSSIVKIAQDATKEGYNQGILTSVEFLRKTASMNPQYSGVLNGCARALEDVIKEYQK